MSYLDKVASKFKGKGELQQYMKYNQYVKKPIRIMTLLDNLELINDLYFKIKTLENKIERTPKGTIKHCLNNTFGCYDAIPIYNSKNNILRGLIFTVILYNKVYVFKLGRLTNRKENTMTGVKAFKILVEELTKDKIDITKYSEDDGKKYKDEISEYPIVNFRLKERIPHVNHIDLNQAWPSALSRAIPEFRKTFERLDKTILNSALGYCQSKYCDFKFSKLAMLGINNTNELIYEMTAKMVMEGFEIVGYNTDGIWYYDKKNEGRLYHDELEGKGLDHWKHDYIDVQFYANSDGQYYIIKPDGKYEFKLRGYYQYETLKPREAWENEDDFFKAIESVVEVRWDEEIGLLVNKGALE